MRIYSKQSGFSAVELLITLFIAAAFMISGFQLYALVIKDGGEAGTLARAGNSSTKYLKRYKSSATSPCTEQTPLTDEPISAIPGLTNVTASVGISCPYSSASTPAEECTGGTITHDGLYTVHKFTTLGSSTLDCTSTFDSKVLVVAGGGGGAGGAGGAGGHLAGAQTLSGTMTVTVGAGGTGDTNAAGHANGANGGDSEF